ncbi:hypothetical protein QBC38DRAFT_359315 [Podospora fimiseda]|uniref:Leucine-rich repeat-containing protein n=1 Tax=Podospora fimiseda TaxID=252190 RepID=A0AAN7H5B4_9PEZI|nr:hypothetical protein QBC38DRAFT_359315 [Podospora fimiseda]
MADEPTLPALPKLRHHPLSEESRRKHPRHAPPSLPSTSSDPAFFSSDDDPALDNYEEQGRRKKRYKGSWFDQQPALSSDSFMDDDPSYEQQQHLKREFLKLDSGIYMSGDDTDRRTALKRVAPLVQSISIREVIARERIDACIEHGRESVDLSDLGLESISDQTLEKLNHIALIPIVDKDVAFEQKDAKIKLFLSKNKLTRFPLSLLSVEYLTDLSLRANGLTEIPPTITKLKNLKTLNIAQNQIRYLPYEFLQMFRKGSKLRSVQIQPNPLWFIKDWYTTDWAFKQRVLEAKQYTALPGSFQSDDVSVRIGEKDWKGLTAAIHLRSRVEFTDSARRVHGFKLPSTDEAQPMSILEPFYRLRGPPELHNQQSASTARVMNNKGALSLLEMALHVLVKSSEADDIYQWLERTGQEGPGAVPDRVLVTMKDAIEFARKGWDLKCSVCGRKTVVPMTRWVEYYFLRQTTVHLDSETGEESWGHGIGGLNQGPQPELYPFLRYGCSWKCVPATIKEPSNFGEAEISWRVSVSRDPEGARRDQVVVGSVSEDEDQGGASVVNDIDDDDDDDDDEGEDTIIA